MSDLDAAARIAAIFDSEGRERKQLALAFLRDEAGPEHLPALAPLLRDPSPRLSARVAALLARHGRRDLFDEACVGLKPGKVAVLDATYRRVGGD